MGQYSTTKLIMNNCRKNVGDVTGSLYGQLAGHHAGSLDVSLSVAQRRTSTPGHSFATPAAAEASWFFLHGRMIRRRQTKKKNKTPPPPPGDFICPGDYWLERWVYVRGYASDACLCCRQLQKKKENQQLYFEKVVLVFCVEEDVTIVVELLPSAPLIGRNWHADILGRGLTPTGRCCGFGDAV